MAEAVKAALPPGLSLSDGWVLRVTAIDPTTGNTVSGVQVSNVSIQARSLTGDAGALESGPFKLVTGPSG